jgi:hypothetical protein
MRDGFAQRLKHPAAPHAAALAVLALIFASLFVGENHYARLSDYFYFYIHLTSNRLYFLHNGFFDLPYYAPSFVAGIPIYGNPIDMTFSIVQILYNVLPDPLFALKLAFLTCSTIAYAGGFMLFRFWKFSRWAAPLGGLLFALNGAVVSRWEVGHLNFHTVWAVPWILYHLHRLIVAKAAREFGYRALATGFLLAAMVYGAGANPFFSLALMCLTYGLTLCFFAGRPAFVRFFAGTVAVAGVAVVVAASKLLATFDVMRQFPRLLNNDLFTFPQSLEIFFRGLFDPFFQIDSRFLGGEAFEFNAYTGVTFFLAVIALVALRKAVRNDGNAEFRRRRFFVIWASVTAVAVFYMIPGQNALWPLIKKLPVFSSQHAVYRLVSALPLALIALVVMAVDSLWRWKPRWAVGFGVLCLLDLLAYSAGNRTVDMPRLPALHRLAPQVRIESWVPVGDPALLMQGKGGFRSINPLFGYEVATARVDPAQPAMTRLADNTYNVNDPVAMAYPRDVGRPPWSRIPAGVSPEQVARFLSFYDPGFFVPARQRVANRVSAFAVIAGLALMAALRRRPTARAVDEII